MNVDLSCMSLSNICEGCLSRDRKLKSEIEPEIKKFFQSIVEPFNCHSDEAHSRHPVALCWECMAIIRRTIKYQKQVLQAHCYLANYMCHDTTKLPQFSALTSHQNPPEITIKQDEDLPRVTRQSVKAFEIEPLSFIKVEEDDNDLGGDLEGYYVGDDRVGEDDKDLKAVVKSDPFTCKEEKQKKKRSKKMTEVEFDESDDEPLKKRTEEELEVELPIEYKPRAKRKKKKEPEVKKNPGSREKPAGVVMNSRVTRKLERLSVPAGQLEMLVLSWEQVEEERQKALANAAFSRHEYRCEACAVGFNHRFKLDNHMKKHDPSSGSLVCGACGIRCRDAHALCAHRRRHRVRWRCVACGELSSRAEVAADHHARVHGAAPPTHTCALCGHTAPTLGKLRIHMKNHSERQKCELCDKTFRDKASLKTHLFIHKGEKEHACPECGKRFLFKKAMQLHRDTHAPPAHLYCHQCDVNFKNRMSYYQHMKYNLKHIDPAMLKYACSLCEKKFAKAARLHDHVLAVHLAATPVKCTVQACTFACSSRPVLRTHIRMVHRNLKTVRNHVCHTCGKAYLTKKTLEGHMRSHTGERPFSCGQCSSTFAYEAALYNHNKLVHLKTKGSRRVPKPGTEATSTTWPLALNLPLPPTDQGLALPR